MEVRYACMEVFIEIGVSGKYYVSFLSLFLLSFFVLLFYFIFSFLYHVLLPLCYVKWQPGALFCPSKMHKTTTTSTTVQPVQNTTRGIQLCICWKLQKLHAFTYHTYRMADQCFPRATEEQKPQWIRKMCHGQGVGALCADAKSSLQLNAGIWVHRPPRPWRLGGSINDYSKTLKRVSRA